MKEVVVPSDTDKWDIFNRGFREVSHLDVHVVAHISLLRTGKDHVESQCPWDKQMRSCETYQFQRNVQSHRPSVLPTPY